MGSIPSDINVFLSTKFTHLVIGGGTAGLVVATRLSEHQELVVGVLEAGEPAYDEPGINVPGRFGETLGTDYDWQFATVPQPGLNGRALPWPRGKVLGGTSALNLMTWNRGCREDYDAWEELGCKGWGWEGLLPFFKKTERLYGSDEKHQSVNHSYFDDKFHGAYGPVHTAYSCQYAASHQYWHETLQKLGVQTNRSHFSGSNVGAWTSLTSVEPERRERSYSATAYYRHNAGRKNLVVLTGATADSVLLDQGDDGVWVAKGARFSYQGESHEVRVQGEVIVSAGSVQSPQLLELSGIGNPEILKAAGVEVKVDNPAVGENLQDHMMTCMIYEIDPSIPTVEELRTDPTLAAAADKEYESSRSGLRTAIHSSVAYLPFSHYLPQEHLSAIASSSSSPNITNKPKDDKRTSLLLSRFNPHTNLGQIEYNFDLSNYSPFYPSQPGKKYATMLQMLQYPFSKGSIHILPIHTTTQIEGARKRATVQDKPIINPKYYEGKGGQIDLEMMTKAQRFGDTVVRTEPLASIIAHRVCPPEDITSKDTTFEGPWEGDQQQQQQEIDLTTWVRDNTITDWHPVGTCAMGGSEPMSGSEVRGSGNKVRGSASKVRMDSVVDPRLRVHGVKGLRVVDASVMPLQISAHLQATVYAIGEKGAGMIWEDWGDNGGV